MPLFLVIGEDGNGKSFVACGALLLNETRETFSWAFKQVSELLGSAACAVVGTVVSDEDHGETSALIESVCYVP